MSSSSVVDAIAKSDQSSVDRRKPDGGLSVATTLPLPAESAVALVQSLGGLTSEDADQRAFAEKVRHAFFEELPRRYEGDARAQGYLRDVLVAVSSALRGMAVERTTFRRSRAREDKLDALRSRISEGKFFHSPIDSERWGKLHGLAIKLLVPTASGAAIVKWWGQLTTSAVVGLLVLAVMGLFFGDLLLTTLIVRLQLSLYRGAGNAVDDVKQRWSTSLASYKELSLHLLIAADRARERWYPEVEGLIHPLRWNDATRQQDVRTFLGTSRPELGGHTPAEILSRLVDLHFGVQPGELALYVPLRIETTPPSVSASATERTPPGSRRGDPPTAPFVASLEAGERAKDAVAVAIPPTEASASDTSSTDGATPRQLS